MRDPEKVRVVESGEGNRDRPYLEVATESYDFAFRFFFFDDEQLPFFDPNLGWHNSGRPWQQSCIRNSINELIDSTLSE